MGAVGIALLTNHEGNYLGNPKFKKFFQYINSRPGKTVVFIHPTAPVIKVGSNFVEANPTQYSTGIVEFYFGEATIPSAVESTEELTFLCRDCPMHDGSYIYPDSAKQYEHPVDYRARRWSLPVYFGSYDQEFRSGFGGIV